MPSFETEFIEAARTYVGKPAIYHQKFTGNCIKTPSPSCREIGVGPELFDCSGLIIRAASDVLGAPVTEWPIDRRHVRDIWQLADDEQLDHQPETVALGALVIRSRQYDIDDQRQIIAGHVGIVSDVQPDFMTYIHADAARGRVEEVRLRSHATTMGFILPQMIVPVPDRINA